MEETAKLPPPVTARDLARILRRRWPVALFTFVAVVAAALFVTSLMPPVYRAKARVLVDKAPALGGPNVLDFLQARDKGLDTEMEKIRSRPYLSEYIVKAKLKDTIPETLLSRLELKPGPGGEILDIAVRAPKAEEAQRTANVVANVYIAAARQEQEERISGSTYRLRKAFAEAKKNRIAKEGAYNAFIKRLGVSDPNSYFGTRTNKLIRVEDVLEDAKKDRAVQERQRAVYARQISTLAPTIETGYGRTKNPLIDEFEAEIGRLTRERNAKIYDFQEDAPEIQDIDYRIAETRKQLTNELKKVYSVGSKNVSRNPDYAAAVSGLINTEAAMAVTNASIAANERLLGRLQAEQPQITEMKGRFEQLSRERASALDTYNRVRGGLDDAVISTATVSSNLRVLEPAQLPTGVESPRPLLNLIMALALGLFLGFGMALLTDYLAGGDEREDEPGAEFLPQLAGIPLLGHVPAALPAPGGGGEAGLPSPAAMPEALADRYREVGYALLHPHTKRTVGGVPVVVLTGTRSDETTAATASQIAATLIRDGLRVTLIDADQAHPRLNKVFGAPDAPGLSDAVAGRKLVGEILHLGANGALRFLAAGSPGDNAPLEEKPLREVLKSLANSKDTDLVIISGPSVWSVRQIGPLEKASDGLVLVSPQGPDAVESIARARRLLSNGYQPRVLGVVTGDKEAEPAPAPALVARSVPGENA